MATFFLSLSSNWRFCAAAFPVYQSRSHQQEGDGALQTSRTNKFGIRKCSLLNLLPTKLGLFSVIPISGRVDRASAAEVIDSGSTPSGVKPKTINNWHSQLPA